MGKSKHSKKWYDDYETSSQKQTDWEKRREDKRRAWEQKNASINPYEHQDDDSREYE